MTAELNDQLKINSKKQLLTLVKIPPLNEAIYLLYRRDRYKHEVQESIGVIDKDMEYYVNSHTCPSNVVGSDYVIIGDDMDPHGLFEHVKTIECPDDYDDSNLNFDEYFKLFKESL